MGQVCNIWITRFPAWDAHKWLSEHTGVVCVGGYNKKKTPSSLATSHFQWLPYSWRITRNSPFFFFSLDLFFSFFLATVTLILQPSKVVISLSALWTSSSMEKVTYPKPRHALLPRTRHEVRAWERRPVQSFTDTVSKGKEIRLGSSPNLFRTIRLPLSTNLVSWCYCLFLPQTW